MARVPAAARVRRRSTVLTYCDAVHVEDGCDGCTGRKDQRLEVREVRLLVVREYLAWGEYFLVPQRPWSMRTLSW